MLDDLFLARLRTATEQAWREGCGSWVPGTRWTGGIDVDALEQRLGVAFPTEHRRFLETLHATRPRRRVVRYDGDEPIECEEPGFYHWEQDLAEIERARADASDGLAYSAEHGTFWMPSWGTRPDHGPERAARVAELVRAAPPLFPILGHRHVVGGTPGLVLSIYDADIIVYGTNLREYLLNELGGLFGERRYEVGNYDLEKVPFWGELVE